MKMLLTAGKIYPRLSRGLCRTPNFYNAGKRSDLSTPVTKQQSPTKNIAQLSIGSRAFKWMSENWKESMFYQNFVTGYRDIYHALLRPLLKADKKPAIFYFMSVFISTALVVGVIMMIRNYMYCMHALEPEDEDEETDDSLSQLAEKETDVTEGKHDETDIKRDVMEDKHEEAEMENMHEKTEIKRDGTEETEATNESVLEEVVKSIEKWLNANNIPGGSVAVSVDGELVLAKGFGMADVEEQVPFTVHTLMDVGVITRAVTVAMAAHHMDVGLLDIDEPIQKYVSSFPEKTWDDKPVTLTTRHLLSDLSGIPNCIPDLNKNQNAAARQKEQTEDLFPWAHDKLFTFMHKPLEAQPGRFTYSINGWDLVGAVLEAIHGVPYPTIMSAFLGHLGMMDSYFNDERTVTELRDQTVNGVKYCHNKTIPHRARLYANGALLATEDHSDHLPSQGLISNALDLVHLGDEMLYNYISPLPEEMNLISSKTMEQMWVARKDTNKKSVLDKFNTTRSPMGWFVKKHPLQEMFVMFAHGNQENAFSMLLVRPPFTTCECMFTMPPGDPSKCECTKRKGKGVVISVLANAYSDLHVDDLCDWAEVISQVYSSEA